MKADNVIDAALSTRKGKDESDPQFIFRLKKLASIAGSVNALARASGVSQGGLQRYMKGGEPTRRILIALASATQVSLNWLMTGEGSMRLNAQSAEGDFDLVPVWDVEVSAGHGRTADDAAATSRIAFRRDWLQSRGLRASSLGCVYARGDSMEPLICNDNLLLVDSSRTRVEEGIYVLRVNDGLFVKRLQQQMNGSVRIISENKEYSEQVIPKTELESLHVIGRVVWIARDI